MRDDDLLKVEKEGSVAWLSINRPEKRNALNMAFFSRLAEVMLDVDSDPDVRAVVIKGEGKCFAVGLDMNEAANLALDASVTGREELRKKILDLQESINAIERCCKPVIAAVHGYCLGGGIDITSACDVRIASKDAVFSIRETKVAIIADMGTLQRMPAIIGQGWFRDLALTGRDFSAEEALEMGFITRICETRDELVAEARKLAEEIAANSPLTVAGTKEVINYTRDHGMEASLQFVAQKNAVLLHSQDLAEAVRAFLEKRPPEFKGK